ncbi:MAG TPA: hypothetical protein PKH81_05230 [Treponemataceae bacterium]|nr:hypothetical protein [Treponemataceae bacterium]
MNFSGFPQVKKRLCDVKIYFLILFCISSYVFADEGVLDQVSLSFRLTTRAETQIRVAGEFIFPFLVGDSALTEGNNIRFVLSADVSPVSVNGMLETVWKPLAVFEISAVSFAGSGWDIPLASGVSFNKPGLDRLGKPDGSARFEGSPFMGMVWGTQLGAAVQFDLGALYPGKWTHVVFRSFNSLRYRALTCADKNDSWQYEHDIGEERNGWTYLATHVLGYQMPFKLNVIALVFEQEKRLYDTPGKEVWGDSYSRFTLGLAGEYLFSDKLALGVLVQIRTKKNYIDSSTQYDWYQMREVDRDDPRDFEFYRLAASLTWIF